MTHVINETLYNKENKFLKKYLKVILTTFNFTLLRVFQVEYVFKGIVFELHKLLLCPFLLY